MLFLLVMSSGEGRNRSAAPPPVETVLGPRNYLLITLIQHKGYRYYFYFVILASILDTDLQTGPNFSQIIMKAAVSHSDQVISGTILEEYSQSSASPK